MSDPDARPSSPARSVLVSDQAPTAEPASDRVDFGHIAEPRIYVRDHTQKQYVLPYSLGKEWTVSFTKVTCL